MKFGRFSDFEAWFTKNLSIFEPQIEKHYAYKNMYVNSHKK